MPNYLKSSNLKPISKKLRKEFDTVLSDPNSPDRFQWDFWHLPDRYTHLRTPAIQFFSAENFELLEKALTRYGREKLGCQNISPLWLSCYVEGCEQRLHADRPHGPWAFVLSLSPAKRKFQGGETMILRPEILSLWNQKIPAGVAFEEEAVLEKIPSVAGQLIVFDPRVPHGVSRVSGTMNPQEGRLVIHGWFTQPQPFVEGPLKMSAANESMSAFDRVLEENLENWNRSTGTIAFAVEVSAAGRVRNVKMLASSLAAADEPARRQDIQDVRRLASQHFLNWKYPQSKKSSRLTLSFSFEN